MQVVNEPSYSEKIQVFSYGGHPYWDAEFPAPPVTTARWKTKDWVKWVDQGNGTWYKKRK